MLGLRSQVYMWGTDTALMPDNATLYENGRKATHVAAGFEHSLILFDDGACVLHMICS